MPSCPDATTMRAALPPAAKGQPSLTLAGGDPLCSGRWAVIGVRYGNSQAVQLFHHADDSWQPQDASTACGSAQLPADVKLPVCNAG